MAQDGHGHFGRVSSRYGFLTVPMARLLLLTPQLPYPPHQGTSLRNFHMLKALSQEHDITLLSFTDGTETVDTSPLQKYCRVLPPLPAPYRAQGTRLKQLLTSPLPDIALRLKSEEFSAALEKALRSTQYDAVQVEGIELASYIHQIKNAYPEVKIVLDCHNAETELQRRARDVDLHYPSRWLAAAYSSVQIGRLARFEAWAMGVSDTVIAVSNTDRSYLSPMNSSKPGGIKVIPNTIDVAEYDRHRADSEGLSFDLVFTGKMDYRPNVDGVLWFAETVWPTLRDLCPAITWAIVGQKPHSRLEILRGKEGITITGFVPQIHPYLAASSIYIVPLRIGSGTRLKILEAMAASLAVVSTRIGAEGFDIEDGKEMVVAESPTEWVDAIQGLLANKERRILLGAAAHEFAWRYDWRTIIPQINQIYSTLLRGNNG